MVWTTTSYHVPATPSNIGLRPTQLIETLASSKITSTEITEKVADAEVTEKEIDAYRERYRPFRGIGRRLVLPSVVNLCVVDPMYQRARGVHQWLEALFGCCCVDGARPEKPRARDASTRRYSLQWFQALFVAAISKAEKAETLEARLDVLNTFFTYVHVNANVCRRDSASSTLNFGAMAHARHATGRRRCGHGKILDGSKDIDATEWRFVKAPCHAGRSSRRTSSCFPF